MSGCCDILRQCVRMCFFIIPIPIGSYTIHNGSSAVVALVSYAVLSLCIPWADRGCKEAAFGARQQKISRTAFVIMWIIVSAAFTAFSAFMGDVWKTSSFWEWPTIGRDVLFIIGMYVEVSVTMLLAYGVSCIGMLSAERR
mgnify:FL=1